MTKSRALTRFAVTVAVALALSVGLVGSASAHDVLISSNPADGSTVATVPTSVTFTFDQPVQNFDPVVSLVGPDGKQYATGTPVISGNTVTGNVGAGPAGAYTAAYRIVSADGHPVTGEIHFTLGGDDAPASASGQVSPSGAATSAASAVASSGASGSGLVSAPTSTAGTTATAAPAAGSGGLSAWLWIGLVVAALVIAVAAVILLRRPARTDRDY